MRRTDPVIALNGDCEWSECANWRKLNDSMTSGKWRNSNANMIMWLMYGIISDQLQFNYFYSIQLNSELGLLAINR